MHPNKYNSCILSTVIDFRRFSMNLFNMWLFKTCLHSLLLSWFTVCLHNVYLMILFTPYCLSIKNSLLKLFTNLNKSPFAVSTRLYLICTCSQCKVFLGTCQRKTLRFQDKIIMMLYKPI